MANSDFLGSGWSFPKLIRHGRISATEDEENISESIWTILATAPGERLMRPEFGCGIQDLLFSLNDSATIGKVKTQVFNALLRWEPRIQVMGVDVEVKGVGEVLLINV